MRLADEEGEKRRFVNKVKDGVFERYKALCPASLVPSEEKVGLEVKKIER